MAAAIHNIIFAKEEDFTFTLTVNDTEGSPVDISGNSFTAEIRRAPDSPLDASFTCTIVGDGSTGQVLCQLPKTETTKLNAYGKYQWDLFRTFDGQRTQLIYGDATVTANITDF
jgi:hypothetical protein